MDWIAAWQADLELRGLKATVGYVGHARRFIAFCPAPLEQVGRPELRAYLAHLKARELAPGSIERAFIALSSLYAFLVEEGEVETNPVPNFRKKYLKPYQNAPRQLISVEDASRLVASILNARDRAIILLLFKTGMRLNELTALDLDSLSLSKMEVVLKPTAKRTNRLLFFDYEAADALGAWLRARANIPHGDALFPSREAERISGLTVDRMVAQRAAAIGLHKPGGREEERFTPHCCRHWFTTHLLRAGMRREYVQWLRGDRITEAIDIYFRIDPEDVRDAYMACAPQLGV